MQSVHQSTGEQRKPWWEVSVSLRCPVIGTCLSIDEQRAVLRKAGAPAAEVKALDDYDVHVLLVQSGGADCPIARRVQRGLEAKYRREAREWGLCAEQELLSRWEEGLRCGRIDALLWIAASHPALSEGAVGRIFGDVHMLMHEHGAIVRRRLQQLAYLQKENGQLQEKLRRARAERREAVQALRDAEQQYVELKWEIARARVLLQPDESAVVCQTQLARAVAQVEAQAAVIERLQAENGELATRLATMDEVNHLLQMELKRTLADFSQQDAICADCPDRQLCAKRILLVGGITRLRAIYQLTVEEMGGEFRYHDGRNNNGDRELVGMIGWADIVLCPVDVNSHNACLSVKKACKRLKKPYHMLPGSGVSSIARALTTYCSPAN